MVPFLILSSAILLVAVVVTTLHILALRTQSQVWREKCAANEATHRNDQEALRRDFREFEEKLRQDYREAETKLWDRLLKKERLEPITPPEPRKPSAIEPLKTFLDEAFLNDEIKEEMENNPMLDAYQAEMLVKVRHQPLTNGSVK